MYSLSLSRHLFINKQCFRKVARSSLECYARTYITQSRWHLLCILLSSAVRRFLLYRSGCMSAAIPGRKARGYEPHLSPPTPLFAAASAEVMATLNIPSWYQTASVHTHHTPHIRTHNQTHTHTPTPTHILLPGCLSTHATWCVCVCVCTYTRVFCFVLCGCMCEGNCVC
jgi:hypothetical protein